MRALPWLLLLAACSGPGGDAPAQGGAALEAAAIERGIVRDPATRAATGLLAREGDRLCLIERGDTVRIGGFIDYGDGIGCTARGSATRMGETLSVDFGQGCRFDAGFDGDRVRFPGKLPAGCERLCTRRASLAGLTLDRLSESASEAEALRTPKGVALCG
ncbi:hypothetical protein [Sphingomonas sp. Leaf4]|uniref:hypothetical protein n=1 Tax=Sphingomonas sp. Leaf4 TaxID=2876553 RepID=UPI001E3357A4|nr:hypothetical protein [Sphingomonas sp. Leaf4]